MATATKSSKKPAVKRAPSKAASGTKVTLRSAPRQPEMRSFQRAMASPFFTFRITRQTLYWTLISLSVLTLGVWVLSINIQVNDIYDQIDATNRTLDILN